MSEQTEWQAISITTGYGANTERGYVQILIKAADWYTQMEPEAARELAVNLWTAAEAADSDGFLMHFIRDRLGVADLDVRAAILVDSREYRDQQRAKDEQRKRYSSAMNQGEPQE